MKHLRHKGRPADWIATRSIGVQLGEQRDCTVVAISLVTGVSYPIAREALARVGRQHGEGAYRSQQEAALGLLGFSVRDISISEIQDRFPTRYRLLRRGVTTYSPRRFPSAFTHLTGRYLFHSDGHVSAFFNGEVKDWAAERVKQVFCIWEVFPRVTG